MAKSESAAASSHIHVSLRYDVYSSRHAIHVCKFFVGISKSNMQILKKIAVLLETVDAMSAVAIVGSLHSTGRLTAATLPCQPFHINKNITEFEACIVERERLVKSKYLIQRRIT